MANLFPTLRESFQPFSQCGADITAMIRRERLVRRLTNDLKLGNVRLCPRSDDPKQHRVVEVRRKLAPAPMNLAGEEGIGQPGLRDNLK